MQPAARQQWCEPPPRRGIPTHLHEDGQQFCGVLLVCVAGPPAHARQQPLQQLCPLQHQLRRLGANLQGWAGACRRVGSPHLPQPWRRIRS